MWPFHKHCYQVKFREQLKNLGNPMVRDYQFSLNSYFSHAQKPYDCLIIETCKCGSENAYIVSDTRRDKVDAEWANTLMILKSEGKF